MVEEGENDSSSLHVAMSEAPSWPQAVQSGSKQAGVVRGKGAELPLASGHRPSAQWPPLSCAQVQCLKGENQEVNLFS